MVIMKNLKLSFNRAHCRRFRYVLIGIGVLLLSFSVMAAAPNASFTVEITSDANTPLIKVINLSREQIVKVELIMGITSAHFDTRPPPHWDPWPIWVGGGRNNITEIPTGVGGSATLDNPNLADTDRVEFTLTGFDYNESFQFEVDIDGAGDDYRKSLFNTQTGEADNAELRVTTATGKIETLKFEDRPAGQNKYVFESSGQPRDMTVSSSSGIESDASAIYVPNCTVRVDGNVINDLDGNPTENIGEDVTIRVYDGELVEISAPHFVYMNNADSNLTDSSDFDASQLDNAMQRFEAIGISVNDVPQTGDPTLYRFTIDEDYDDDPDIEVKWRHDFALRIASNFERTESLLRDADGDPWVPRQKSEALGNPDPAVKMHWIPKGDRVIAAIDGQVIDYTHPGLDVRFVPIGYDAAGAADFNHDTDINSTNFYPFTVGQAPASRQQVEDEFTMDGPALIDYIWRIQYGVKVNVDDVTRNQLPIVYDVDADKRHFGEGTFWFDPGTKVQVLCRANESAGEGKALAGWFNGDGFYFKAAGTVDTTDRSLLDGIPDECDWIRNVQMDIPEGSETNTYLYIGMDIDVANGVDGLERPVRVMWTYGNQAIAVTVPIGEYVLQNAVTNTYGIFTGDTYITPPEKVQMISISGTNTQVSGADMTIWDDAAGKLYPLIPGTFRATWSNANDEIDVLVTSFFPDTPHYPHIADTPPVNLDPDPTDSFVFKEVRYSENGVVVDANNEFRATTPGWTVLLFGELQLQGRGQPREFLRVRTVESKNWRDCLEPNKNAIIGQAITDTDLDLAELDTGYVLFNGARYNPLVYDAEKLDGLAAQDVYDMDALRSTMHERIVVTRDNLPGPVIPVNLHPGAQAEERIVVAWYDDPAMNDDLLWPYAARTYLPEWPETAEEGLGRIVIASQFGSESLGTNGQEQVVADAFTNLTADANGNAVTNTYLEEITYNPTRLQQVQVYSQPNPAEAGYNPNEEHALLAPSLKNAAVSPRPPSVYALRNNDLNRHKSSKPYTEGGQPPDYTSDPYVLVQFFDTAEQTYKMRVYEVQMKDDTIYNYYFANSGLWSGGVTPAAFLLKKQPYVEMEAGEPVIPFYPLGDVWGAVVPPETFGTNITSQLTYWEDHKGTSWSVSGGTNAWFTQSPYYPLQPDFWWPDNEPGMIVADEGGNMRAEVPMVGNSLSFLPASVSNLLSSSSGDVVTSAVVNDNKPAQILYKSEWPDVVPVLKAGETLTFSGGEYRADHPTSLRIGEDGELETVETPGLPAVLAFAAAEVVFDSLNPTGDSDKLKTGWTARVGQVLEKRSTELPMGEFPSALAPASGRTRISQGKYVFNELPASLQKRFRYDPVGGKLEIFGLVNDKDIGEDTLTASPPAVYVLEPNILTVADLDALRALDTSPLWRGAIGSLYDLTRNPDQIERDSGQVINGEYLVGLERKILRDPVTGEPDLVPIEPGSEVMIYARTNNIPAQLRAFGPGLALLPNADFLNPSTVDPTGEYYVTVVENNDPSLGGSPITPHIIKVDPSERYRGAIKTILSDNVFDENVVLRHQGDFGANADSLFFEWWYRPDDGSLDVPPPDDDLFDSTTSPWKLFPDLSGKQGKARYEVTLKGNPNAPEALLADTWWFCRYRHNNDSVDGIDWDVPQLDGTDEVNFTWAGAGNSDPLGVYNFGIPDYKAQLVMGWIKRVLDAVNPYEARIRDFEGESPSTVVSMLAQFGARFEGPVALNPAKDVIENVGLIELYETILKRGRDLSIDLSRPVSTPAIANALQLAATRISDFYMLLANEAYTDALDPTIGHGSESAAYGHLAPAVFTFQNQMSTLIEEELALLRGVDDNFARPVYNRLFWNFTKGEGEAAYAVNYNVSDVNMDGFIDEDDAMMMFPQGHGDAWGHYLTALRNQYDLLGHKYFNWVSPFGCSEGSSALAVIQSK